MHGSLRSLLLLAVLLAVPLTLSAQRSASVRPTALIENATLGPWRVYMRGPSGIRALGTWMSREKRCVELPFREGFLVVGSHLNDVLAISDELRGDVPGIEWVVSETHVITRAIVLFSVPRTPCFVKRA